MTLTKFRQNIPAVLASGTACVALAMAAMPSAIPINQLVGGMGALCAFTGALSAGLLVSAGATALTGVGAPVATGLAVGGVITGAGFLIFCT